MLRSFLFILVLSIVAGCANIVPPGGGKKDVSAPKLRNISPADSQLNTRVNRIEMYFDEFVTVSDVSKELHISPALTIAPTMTGTNKKVVIKIADSLLQENTTYRISFGNAIKDLHEGNVYISHPYTFSTGGWFDSLQLKGVVYDAASGLLDSGATTRVLLYDAALADDIVVKQKPAYVTTSDKSGHFLFQGLPNKTFKIFALREKNDNLQFDGDDELIAFYDVPVQPKTDTGIIRLDIFKELPDSLRSKKADSSTQSGSGNRRPKIGESANSTPQLDNKHFMYQAQIDTSDRRRRTVGIVSPLTVFFSRKIKEINAQRISLHADSADIEIESRFTASIDTSMKKMSLQVNWKENTLYTLRLLKGFAKDSVGTDALPSKYIFRTKQEEDYGKMEVHLPVRYIGKQYLLNIVHGDADSVYLLPISDTVVVLNHLDAGLYKINVIHDTNEDGKWNTGDLKKRKHPEAVIPYSTTIMMKPGWEHQIDFDKK